MLSSAITRTLTVQIDPQEQVARAEVPSPDRVVPYVARVSPGLGGWLVTDPSDDEPIWRSTLAEAIGEAVVQASCALEDRLLRALGGPAPAAAGQLPLPAADVC